jgi:uncharacterized membrane protein (Fun14 family)
MQAMKKGRLIYALLTIILIAAVVFSDAALGYSIKNSQQVTSLIVGVLFLSALVMVKSEPYKLSITVIYVCVGIAATIGWAVIWDLSSEEYFLVGLVSIALALTSRLWLKAV